ncbi:MAG TPA: CRTAC1 family protein, partial [Candidatus Dormibacteraeota bacterium]|nr:CRTAC1 family protein [Candidatus Dormibacteraeota bacterium]
DVSYSAGVARVGNNMGVAAASLYGDGLIDLYTTDITDPTLDYGTTQGNALFIARRASDGSVVYSDQASLRGVRDSGWGWGAAFVDMRLDGRLDLFAAQGFREMIGLDNPLYYGRSHLFLNDASNHFTDTRGTGCDVLGDQRAVIPFDFNRDGSPDLLVTQVDAPVQLLENQTRGRHWLTVDLSHAGPEAAGAEISVTVAGRTTTQLVLLGGSYLAGPPLEAYFGLGESTTADSVSVRWANGGESVLRDVSGDQVLKVSRQ